MREGELLWLFVCVREGVCECVSVFVVCLITSQQVCILFYSILYLKYEYIYYISFINYVYTNTFLIHIYYKLCLLY